MIIERISSLTGKHRKLEIDITPEQIKRWKDGELIQNVAPHLTPEDREFIITGNTQEEWDAMFGDEDED
jgi:hypothetical protein